MLRTEKIKHTWSVNRGCFFLIFCRPVAYIGTYNCFYMTLDFGNL